MTSSPNEDVVQRLHRIEPPAPLRGGAVAAGDAQMCAQRLSDAVAAIELLLKV